MSGYLITIISVCFFHFYDKNGECNEPLLTYILRKYPYIFVNINYIIMNLSTKWYILVSFKLYFLIRPDKYSSTIFSWDWTRISQYRVLWTPCNDLCLISNSIYVLSIIHLRNPFICAQSHNKYHVASNIESVCQQ